MGKDEKIYSHEDFALILRKAAELAGGSEVSPKRSAELLLEDMKAIAAEAGLDPALIERVARSGSLVDPASGGLVKRRLSASFPTKPTKERTSHLLSVIRAATQQQGGGEATSSGLVWRGWLGGPLS